MEMTRAHLLLLAGSGEGGLLQPRYQSGVISM